MLFAFLVWGRVRLLGGVSVLRVFLIALVTAVFLALFSANALPTTISIDSASVIDFYTFRKKVVACYTAADETVQLGTVRSATGENLLSVSPLDLSKLKIRIVVVRNQFVVSSARRLKIHLKALRARYRNLRRIREECLAVTPNLDDTPSPNSTPTSTPTPTPSPDDTPTPQPSAPPSVDSLPLCSDGLDNDADSLIDASDPQCQTFPHVEYDPALHANGSLVDGWSVYQASSDSRIVYVSSSSGNNASDGLSSLTPKQTIAAALGLLRHGFPDWMLLKRGDTFGAIGAWRNGGRSASEPAVIASYGAFSDPRPLIQSAGLEGFRISAGGGAPLLMGHVVMADLAFSALPRDTVLQNPTGVRLQKDGLTGFVLEGCEIADFHTGLVIQITGGEIQNTRIRRNVIRDSRAGNGSHAQGLYTDEVRNILIEDNVVDRNGGAAGDPLGNAPDIFKHNMYIQADGRQVTIKGNIIARASSHGVQLRPGGTLEDNLIFDNPINVLVGGASGEFTSVRGNVLSNPSPFIIPSLPRGDSLHLQNLNGSEVVDNIFTSSAPTTSGGMLDINTGNDFFPMQNTAISQNIFYGGGRIIDVADFGSLAFENISFSGNDFQQGLSNPAREIVRVVSGAQLSEIAGVNNRYFSVLPLNQWSDVAGVTGPITNYLSLIGDTTSVSEQASYPQPRDVDSYAQTLGGSNALDFLAAARLQSKSNWNHALTAQSAISYIRSGFGL